MAFAFVFPIPLLTLFLCVSELALVVAFGCGCVVAPCVCSRYSDFTKGDKVAEYGLAALIAGGTGAVLIKTGLLAKLWKFIVIGIAAIAGFIKKVFRSIFGGNESKIEDPNKQAAAQGQ